MEEEAAARPEARRGPNRVGLGPVGAVGEDEGAAEKRCEGCE